MAHSQSVHSYCIIRAEVITVSVVLWFTIYSLLYSKVRQDADSGSGQQNHLYLFYHFYRIKVKPD